MEDEKFESPVKTLRLKADVSQRQMADALEVHHSVIAGLEAGVIELDEEDNLVENKVGRVFDSLSDWSGTPREELVKKQIEYNQHIAQSIQEKANEKVKNYIIQNYVKQQIRQAAEEESGSENPVGEELEWFLDTMAYDCHDKCISPLSWLRGKAQITQRQLALAAEAPQTFVARVELGEVSLFGPRTGSRLLEFILEALGYSEPSKQEYDMLYTALYECQETFIKDNAKRAKNKVKSSLEKLKDLGKQD